MKYAILAGAVALALTGCSAPSTDAQPLVLVTHDSFALSDGILDEFTKETGIAVQVQSAGDAGQLVNTLVLTKDSPLGDVVFGIDNTFASRAVESGVLADYASKDLTSAEDQYLLPEGQGGGNGRRMLETLFDALRDLGVPGVHLGVGADNTRAIGFYEHLGFRRLGDGGWQLGLDLRR